MTLEELRNLEDMNNQIQRKEKEIDVISKRLDKIRGGIKDSQQCFSISFLNGIKKEREIDYIIKGDQYGVLSNKSSLALMSEIRKILLEEKKEELKSLKQQFNEL